MEFLSLDEIAFLENEIHSEQRALFNNRAIITKTKSNQWLFFNDCIELLFNPNYISKYFSEPATKLAQLKFEIENKLKNFYLKPGRKIEYVFKLVHKKELKNIIFDEIESYPSVKGYSALIRKVSNTNSVANELTERDIKDYIERIIAEAIDIEFEAYQTIPQIISDDLLNYWYCPNGPAKKEILHIINRHIERGWVINNFMNPSTKRILDIKVKDIKNKELYVSTIEYWYLRWWDTKKNAYTYPYRETTRQRYILRKVEGIWKIYEIIMPAPRTSVPHRRKYSLT
ncbi:MAG: hypothetical protein M0P71_03670 [Melioribacteraceae bacterium]|nr:hypothetical protein [Melioribacteraceae bacterium]